MAVEREKALEMALGQIEKQYGKGSVMKMGEKTSMDVESIPTGALSLDIALGIGGLPRGRVIEVFGPESSGKSTLAMHVVAEAQRNGGICAYVDAEHAMDPVYARSIGVDIDELLISQPDTGEQALEITDMLVRSGALDVVVPADCRPVCQSRMTTRGANRVFTITRLGASARCTSRRWCA